MFVHALGVGTLGTFAPLDMPLAAAATARVTVRPDDAVPLSTVIRVGNNENPYGPGPGAIAAINAIADRANRYPGALAGDLVSAISARHGIRPEHILLSGGSGDIMRAAVYAFTSPTRALVTARPSYEAPMRSAQHIGSPVIRVPLAPDLRLDLAAMGARAVGSGLVYICNPNNPTSTVVRAAGLAALIERIIQTSPDTRILVDEAYLDYADLTGGDTMIPLVTKYPHVIVTRTFSKIHGMAGMRVAYAVAQQRTLEQISLRHSRSSVSALSLAAATASLEDTAYTEKAAAMNRMVRAFMVSSFTNAGYQVAAADANFIFVNLKRDSREFAEGCRLKGVLVGRPFPPMNRWARISVGTREEMDAAMAVFMSVLATSPRNTGTAPRAAATA